MRKTFRLKSMMLTLMAMLAVGMMSVSLTACSSDDDDNGGNKGGNDDGWPAVFTNTLTVGLPGMEDQTISIGDVVWEESENAGVEYYVFGIVPDDKTTPLPIVVPKAKLNQLLDLTKNQQVLPTSPVTVGILNMVLFAYGEGEFESGSTFIASFDGTNLKLAGKGSFQIPVDDDDDNGGNVQYAPKRVKSDAPGVITFDINYSGTATRNQKVEEAQ